MGAPRHGQGGSCPPPWKYYTVFCALVVTVKRSVNQLFTHHFHNFCQLLGGFAPRSPPGFHLWTPLGTFVSRLPNLPTPGKKSCERPWLSRGYNIVPARCLVNTVFGDWVIFVFLRKSSARIACNVAKRRQTGPVRKANWKFSCRSA